MKLQASAMIPGRIYVLPDGTAQVTPDGVGRYFYANEDEAYEDYDGAVIYWEPPGESVMVVRRSTFGSALVAECPECGVVCAYWDDDDLNEDGELTCNHTGITD